MIKIENTQVFGFEAAFRGMRNPKNSWALSDSTQDCISGNIDSYFPEQYSLGKNDAKLAATLIKAGTEHCKFVRFIECWAVFTLPIFIWSEFDTYKIGRERNSCSTMHKLSSRPLTQEDFEKPIKKAWLKDLNDLMEKYKDLKDSDLFEQLKNDLPSGYLQKADIKMNYATCMNVFKQRKNHRLSQWRFTGKADRKSICNWIYSLPYMDNFLKAAELV